MVAGQQPAYAGGPLYTLLKAAHAVALARHLDQTGKPVAALFWCASEDHDLGEADHADLIARDGRITRLRADLGGGSQALRHRFAAIGWEALVAGLAAHEPAGLGQTWVRDHAPRAGETFGAWHCRLLMSLLPTLTAIEGHVLRPAWRATLRQALESWPAAALAAHRSAHCAAGGSDPFGPLDAPPVFFDAPDGRRALSPAAARAQFELDPDQLSPGAALRPILQQAALPCTHFIAGPGELAYHALLTPLYPALGVGAPILVQRSRATLIPAWFQRACSARGWEPHALPAHEPAFHDNGLNALDAALATLIATHPELPASHARLRRERDRLERGLIRRRAPQRLGALRAWLRPRQQPQERVMPMLQAVWAYGPGLARLCVEHAASLPHDTFLRV